MQKARSMLDLEREGWLPVHEGEQQQGLHLAQEGVLEGVLEVLEVLAVDGEIGRSRDGDFVQLL